MTDGADSLEENKAKPAAPVTAGEAKPDGIIADVPGKGKLAPKERRRAPRFESHKPWKYYAITISPVILLLCGALPFHHFIVEVVLANMILNGLIIFVLFLGAAIIMLRVKTVQKYSGILKRFTDAFKAGIPISEVLQDPSVYYSGVGHVVVHIAETEGRINSRLIQDAINEELEHVQHTFQAGYEVPNYIVGFMIAMGLTGTFIGLLETMLGISDMLGGINAGGGGDMTEAVMGLITELQKPLAGMGTAFSASLFGLIGSSVLGMMMLAQKYSVSQFMNSLRRYINTVVEHEIVEAPAAGGRAPKANKSRGGGMSETFLTNFLNEFSESQLQTQESFRQGQENTTKLSLRINKLADSLSSVGETLKAQVETSKKMYDLLGYGPRMRDLAEETLAEMRKGNEAQKQQGVATGETTRAIGQLDQRMNSVNISLGELSQWLASDSGHKQGNAKAMLAAITTLQDRMTQVVQETEQNRNVSIDIARHLSSQAESQKKLIELLGFGGRMRDIADQTLSEMKVMTSLQREGSGASEQLGTTLTSLDQRFVRITNQLAQMASDLTNQSEAGRNELKDMSSGFVGVQDQLSAVAREAAQSRNVSIDIARHLTEANSQLKALRSGNEILVKIQDGAAVQTEVLESMVSEIRNARTTVVRDLRAELRELAAVLAPKEKDEEEDEEFDDEDEES